MAGRFPLKIKLIDFLGIFGFNQLGYKLKLFSEFEYRFLKDGYFSRRPFLKYRVNSDWADEDVQVSLFVQMVYRIEIELNGLLFLFRVGLVDLALRGDHLQNRILSRSQSL